MQAASLFAFAQARAAHVAMVALVSNGVDQIQTGFDTGGHEFRRQILAAVERAARAYLQLPQDSTTLQTPRSESRRTRGEPV